MLSFKPSMQVSWSRDESHFISAGQWLSGLIVIRISLSRCGTGRFVLRCSQQASENTDWEWLMNIEALARFRCVGTNLNLHLLSCLQYTDAHCKPLGSCLSVGEALNSPLNSKDSEVGGCHLVWASLAENCWPGQDGGRSLIASASQVAAFQLQSARSEEQESVKKTAERASGSNLSLDLQVFPSKAGGNSTPQAPKKLLTSDLACGIKRNGVWAFIIVYFLGVWRPTNGRPLREAWTGLDVS